MAGYGVVDMSSNLCDLGGSSAGHTHCLKGTQTCLCRGVGISCFRASLSGLPYFKNLEKHPSTTWYQLEIYERLLSA